MKNWNRVHPGLSYSLFAKHQHIGEVTVPWAIFHLRIFLNYLSHKFEKIKITVWNNGSLIMNGNFGLDIYRYYYIEKAFPKKNWHLAQGRVLYSCLGPYICISVNTKLKIFFFCSPNYIIFGRSVLFRFDKK